VLPPFDENGNLPPGEHQCSWQEFVARFGINNHRLELLEGMKRALLNLKDAGCTKVWIDGSFTTCKDEPADYDGMWYQYRVDVEKIDPLYLDAHDMFHGSRLQKAIYLGEFFPYSAQYLEQFSIDRQGNAKGTVVMNPQEVMA
jgi:hypothetical protein